MESHCKFKRPFKMQQQQPHPHPQQTSGSSTRRPMAEKLLHSSSFQSSHCNGRHKTRPTSSGMLVVAAALLTVLLPTRPILASSNQIVLLDGNNNHSSNSMSLSANHHQQQQLLASFSTPEQAINITHVTYDPLHDTVYLGATNNLYQLNGSDLSVQHHQTTGPILDNPSCGISDCHNEEIMKPTTNVNKILVIDYQHKKLLSCGSVKQGACRRYQLNNIAQKEDLISMAVAANDDNSSTYAFIAPARYTYDRSSTSSIAVNINNNNSQQQQVLYVATTYTKVGQNRDLLVPAIGTRILDDGQNLLKLYENSFLDSARIDINTHLRDYFLVNYLYGFASSNYVYFVTVQKKATSRDYEELGYHTRLARICITDSSYNSYTEVDLKCMPNKRRSSSFAGSGQAAPNEYPLLQDAILVDAGSQLLQSLAQNDQSPGGQNNFYFNDPASGSASSDDNKVLLGVFSSARDHTQHAGEHSAICAFSLSQIEDKFNDNIHNCYTGKMQSRNMEYIAGNVQDCPKSGQGGNVVNFCTETLKINGTLPIVSEASIQYFNTTLTAITATSQVNSNTKNIYSDQLASELSAFNSSSPRVAASSGSTPSSVPTAGQSSQNQHTVVFVGTSGGHIKKLLLNEASAAVEFEDLQLDSEPILGDLHLHASGRQLIVATPYKLVKVPTHNCSQHSSCRECSQSRNPYCGWCLLKQSCSTRAECYSPASQEQASPAGAANSKQQLKWIPNESSVKCIDLQAIVPDRVPITSTGKIDLYIDRLPRLAKEHTYRCVFDRKEQTSATLRPFGLSCPLSKVMHRPKLEAGKDHATIELAVRSSETNADFLTGKLTFFECQQHTSCNGCLGTRFECSWCLSEGICLFNTSKCERSSPGQPLITIGGGEAAGARLSLTTISSSEPSGLSGVGQPSRPRSNTISQPAQCPPGELVEAGTWPASSAEADELAAGARTSPSQPKQPQQPPEQPARARAAHGQIYLQQTLVNGQPANSSQPYLPYSLRPALATTAGYPYLAPVSLTPGAARPEEPSGALAVVSGVVSAGLVLVAYLALGSALLAFVYSALQLGYRLRRRAHRRQQLKRVQAEVDSLEKSIRGECRLASLALRGELAELARHVELTGAPLLNMRHYIMKVFFPGIGNHPLLAAGPASQQRAANQSSLMMAAGDIPSLMGQPQQPPAPTSLQQQQHQTIHHLPLNSSAKELPMEHFERLVMTKPFLIMFIDTLERQPTFSIRDKVNVASLIMIILMERLDYATDIMRTLLLQLVHRSTSGPAGEQLAPEPSSGQQRAKSHLLDGFPSAVGSRRQQRVADSSACSSPSRAPNLGKMVGGGASRLLSGTQLAAQTLLAKVAGKSSAGYLEQSRMLNGSHSATLAAGHDMSTTTFNNRNTINFIGAHHQKLVGEQPEARPATSCRGQQAAHLMLRKTDSVVEKVLTNWLALNMYDSLRGETGHSLYLLFEALRGQLERGPIDSVSGDAYYSLNEHKLLREPQIRFEYVNLYVIADTDIMQPAGDSRNLLIDSGPYAGQPTYEDPTANRAAGNYNTITLALRVLDCDTIGQVKAKILAALYRNSPFSARLAADQVELALRQQQPDATLGGRANQPVAVGLHDEDYTSAVAFDGTRRLNTLAHYGVTDQAIVMLTRSAPAGCPPLASQPQRSPLADMLDEHYSNPYSEIQFGSAPRAPAPGKAGARSWHLARSAEERAAQLLPDAGHSNDSSPASQSPSMLLLGHENTGRASRFAPHQQQHFYHPSSSSTSSTGNVMDTNSTSMNSSSMNVHNLLAKGRASQPIYCQIGSTSAASQHGASNNSNYYCQIGAATSQRPEYRRPAQPRQPESGNVYLARMLTSKGAVQSYIDDFFRTILSARQPDESASFGNSTLLCADLVGTARRSPGQGSCPPAVKWLFDLLDEAAIENGITDQSVVHSWKSNAFLLRFWANLVKNPNYVLDVDKSSTMDASLSVIAQTLMDSCSSADQQLTRDSSYSKMLFSKDIPKYRSLVKSFYQDVANMRPVSDQEMARQMSSISANPNARKFDTNLALKELCVYAVNYGVELMNALNGDFTCQQLDLSQKLEQCFRSFTLFEAYR